MSEKNVKVSIVVPTYNERENVELLCDGIRTVLGGSWDYEVIIVDDNSPDGTAGVVRQLARGDSRIRLLERPGKLGLGSAVVEGFRMAEGDYWFMMDADLSHRPEDLPALLKGLEEADIVIGSRYTPGGGTVGWPLYRRIISRGASAAARLLVGLKVRDLTSGFVGFHKQAAGPLLPALNPKGFKLLLEILAKARRGTTVKEVPIIFVDRQYGRSKANLMEVGAFFQLCFELRSIHRQLEVGK